MDYVNLLSHGGLTVPSSSLVDYVCNGFAYIDHAICIINSSKLPVRKAAKLILQNTMKDYCFLCENHNVTGLEIVNTIIANIYFNNSRKRTNDATVVDNIVTFRKRQREK